MKKDKCIILVFLSLFICGLFSFFYETKTVDWYFTSYILDYKNGFISRGLIGSIFQLFFSIDDTYRFIVTNIIKLSFFVIFILFILFLLNMTKKIKDMFTREIFLLIGISSFPILYFYPSLSLKLDFIWIYTYFISIIMLFKNGFNIINSIFVSIISILAILSHQAFIFTTFPFIFLIGFIDSIIYYKENKIDKILHSKNIGLFIFITTSCILFIICQFFGKIDIKLIYEDVFNKLVKMGELTTIEEFRKSSFAMMVNCEYNLSVFSHLKILKNDWLRNLTLLIFLIPMLILNIIFMNEILKQKFKKNSKYIFIFLAICQLPLFFLTTELIRWTFLFHFNTFLFTCFYLCKYKLYSFKTEFFKKYKLPMFTFTLINVLYSYFFSIDL